MIKLFISTISFLILFANGLSLQAQIINPVKWSYSAEQKDKEATLILKATVENKYHIYSQFLGDGGPIPTSFKFEPSADYELIGKTIEPPPHTFYDSTFEMTLAYFDVPVVVFRQKVKIKTTKPFSIKGSLEFMACDDKMCLPPDGQEFKIKIKGIGTEVEDTTDTGEITPVTIDNSAPTPPSSNTAINSIIAEPNADVTKLEPGCGGEDEVAEDKSYLGIMIAGMVGGLLALLTPCVFPMIPLTVSFFTKRSGTRSKGITNAIIYALSIIFIYVALGFLVTVTLGSDALNAMASNAFFNLLFFVIFFIFALSFFGAFEITLPSWMINKADSASDKGGLVGIFFMAFTLSLVSFSCTGPIIGTLLVEAAHGNSYIGPIAGMTGFALALALPFALFAAFPSWLNNLPKSGGWLNSVKVTLGFLELALALKFLSNVDLAYHWGLLKREVFITLWIVIFGMMGFYLLGKLRFSHDSEVPHIGIGRLLFSILSLGFTVYLIPGLWGAPLKLISGFPPPEFYKEWITTGSNNHCPHNLNCYHDYEEGMAVARSQNKPVLIDFTGWSCVNCRKMEDNVWSDPMVLKKLSEDYVLISLYVDDKKALPESEQYESKTTGKKIKSTGNKWSDLQSRVFETNSQPYYVLLDNKGNMLAKPRGYTPDIDQYNKYLEEGLCRYRKRIAENS